MGFGVRRICVCVCVCVFFVFFLGGGGGGRGEGFRVQEWKYVFELRDWALGILRRKARGSRTLGKSKGTCLQATAPQST